MARLIPGVTATPTPRRADPLTDLTLLLSRLQRTILHADAEREARLRESEFEREKARANINYARSLLTKLEQETLALKIHSRRQEVQADLVRKREVLEQLSERISDLAEFAAAGHPGHGEDEDTSDGEDILADIIATPSESIESTKSPDSALEEPTEDLNQIPDSQESPPSPPQPKEQKNTPRQPEQPPPSSSARIPSTTPPPPTTTATAAATTTTTSQALRFRQPEPPVQSSSTQETAAATGSSLFGDAKQRSSALTTTPAAGAATTAEAILDHQRAEQDALSESILRLASELKASSHAFSASLEEDREVVTRAGKGLDQTGRQLEGVTRRMGALQRLTEGEGWWGRMRLYAIVYGLMVALVLVVFVLPKLRF